MQSSPPHGVVVVVVAGEHSWPGTQSVAGGVAGPSGVGTGSWLVGVGTDVDIGFCVWVGVCVGVEASEVGGAGRPAAGAAPALTAIAVNTATDNTATATTAMSATRTGRLPDPTASTGLAIRSATVVGDNSGRCGRRGSDELWPVRVCSGGMVGMGQTPTIPLRISTITGASAASPYPHPADLNACLAFSTSPGSPLAIR